MRGVALENEVQKIANEHKDWTLFNLAVKEFEESGDDPTKLKVYSEGGRDYRLFSDHDFSVVYDCDAKTKTAQVAAFISKTYEVWIDLGS